MSQSLASILVHIVFSTKLRQPLIFPTIMVELHAYMSGIAKSQGSDVYEIGGTENHVHLLISLPRTMPLSKLVEEIKKSSSKWIKTKDAAYNNFSWQNGYGAFSIGQSNMEALKKYIRSKTRMEIIVVLQATYMNDIYLGRCPRLLLCQPFRLRTDSCNTQLYKNIP